MIDDPESDAIGPAGPAASSPLNPAALDPADVEPAALDTAKLVSPGRRARVEGMLARRLGSVVAVAESVRRRHNTSAILRTCEAFGVHEVHLVTAGFRASPGAARGAERWVLRRRFDTTTQSLTELKSRGFRIFVADFWPEAFTPETVPVDAPVALVFGSEVRGVSDEARALADGAVMIPMLGLTQSLNVSVSAAILLRSITERRRALVGADLSEAARAAFFERWLRSEARSEFGRRARAHGVDPAFVEGIAEEGE